MTAIRIERLSATPIRVVTLFPGASKIIPLGAMVGPPGPLAERLQVIAIVIDGNGVPIIPGPKADIFIPYECDIVEWTVIGDRDGTISIDVERDSLLSFPPELVDSIVGATPPRLIAQQVRSGLADDWQKSIPARSVLRYRVLASDTVQRVTVALTVERK